MYRPHGRYRYTRGVVSLSERGRVSCPLWRSQNWRAGAAMIASVSLTLPGLINSINPNIHVGVCTRLFKLGYLLGVSDIFRSRWLDGTHFNPAGYRYPVQFTLASAVYFTLSRLFPARETMLDHAILEQEMHPDDRSHLGGDEKKVDCQVDDV